MRYFLLTTAALLLTSYGGAMADTLGEGAPTAAQRSHCLDAWNQPIAKCMALKNKCEKAGGIFSVEEGPGERAPEAIYYWIYYKCKK
jgi:hypothetical protein